MFERFTDRARHSVVFAQDEARDLKNSQISEGHLLLGLSKEAEGVAGQVLTDVGFDPAALRDRLRGDEVVAGHIPFTHQAKKVLELALREALQLGHNYIGSEHILLALCRIDFELLPRTPDEIRKATLDTLMCYVRTPEAAEDERSADERRTRLATRLTQGRIWTRDQERRALLKLLEEELPAGMDYTSMVYGAAHAVKILKEVVIEDATAEGRKTT